jgi:hypothetical protein
MVGDAGGLVVGGGVLADVVADGEVGGVLAGEATAKPVPDTSTRVPGIPCAGLNVITGLPAADLLAPDPW